MALRATKTDLGDQPTSGLALDVRPGRPSSIKADDEDNAATEVAAIMSTASNPVSPGSSSPTHDASNTNNIVPPARPSSTPFPAPEQRTEDTLCSSCPASETYDGDFGQVDYEFTSPPAVVPQSAKFDALPAEIHECILDHLFGFRVSATSKSSLDMASVTRRWGTALRHSRRRELSDLSLVNKAYRDAVQERLFRHIKVKASQGSVHETLVFFAQHTHLRSYVKHVEVWFSVFQPQYGPFGMAPTATLPTVTLNGFANPTYVLPNDNCALEEAFYLVSTTFPEACVLTLEGGDRRKAPQVRLFITASGEERQMPSIPTVETLVCRGTWNLVRSENDFSAITSALPNLKEWHASYPKAKSKSYLSMSTIVPRLASNLSSLNLCLEGDYRRELSIPPFFAKVAHSVHFCARLAEAIPTLEHLSYTGRICKGFFAKAGQLADPRTTRLKSIDLTVKNCCRPLREWGDSGTGINDWEFIKAFEQLVLAGIRSLRKLTAVEFLRIRYVDLGKSTTLLQLISQHHVLTSLSDSPVPALNPYFSMNKAEVCHGIWSPKILTELSVSRPYARFEELSDTFGGVVFNETSGFNVNFFSNLPRTRLLSQKVNNYCFLAPNFMQP